MTADSDSVSIQFAVSWWSGAISDSVRDSDMHFAKKLCEESSHKKEKHGMHNNLKMSGCNLKILKNGYKKTQLIKIAVTGNVVLHQD